GLAHCLGQTCARVSRQRARCGGVFGVFSYAGVPRSRGCRGNSDLCRERRFDPTRADTEAGAARRQGRRWLPLGRRRDRRCSRLRSGDRARRRACAHRPKRPGRVSTTTSKGGTTMTAIVRLALFAALTALALLLAIPAGAAPRGGNGQIVFDRLDPAIGDAAAYAGY